MVIVVNFAPLVNFHLLPELLLVLSVTVVLPLFLIKLLVNTVPLVNSLLKEELAKSAQLTAIPLTLELVLVRLVVLELK